MWHVVAATVTTGVGRATDKVRELSGSALRSPRGFVVASATLLGALMLLLPTVTVVQIVLTAHVDDRSMTQAIVVLDPGHVWGDDDLVQAARWEHAAELYAAGVAPVVVLTGPERLTAEARGELMRRGVPTADIVALRTGRDTVGSLDLVAQVMRDLGWSSATVVTDPAQAARADATASALGIDAHMSPTTRGAGTSLTSESVGPETLALLRFQLVTRWSLPRVIG